MMNREERAKMARACRREAAFASTPHVREMLLELALHYEGSAASPAIELDGRSPSKLDWPSKFD
jgi:hypothetical protein